MCLCKCIVKSLLTKVCDHDSWRGRLIKWKCSRSAAFGWQFNYLIASFRLRNEWFSAVALYLAKSRIIVCVYRTPLPRWLWDFHSTNQSHHFAISAIGNSATAVHQSNKWNYANSENIEGSPITGPGASECYGNDPAKYCSFPTAAVAVKSISKDRTANKRSLCTDCEESCVQVEALDASATE